MRIETERLIIRDLERKDQEMMFDIKIYVLTTV